MTYLQLTEAATGCVLYEKVLLEISQNSKKNTCIWVPFLIKLQACNFIKKETLAQVFSCEFCKISKNTFLHRTPLVAVSEYQSSSSNYWVNEVVKTWSKWWSERICECTVLVYLVEVTVLSVIFFLCLSTQSFRSSCPKVFFRKIVPRNFAKFTGKHLCQVSFLIKLSAEACNFIIRETLVHSLELH